MKKVLTILCFVILGHQPECLAQFNQQIDSLCIVCNRSITDSEKVVALGKLADYYYSFKLNSKGDSILHEQLLIAEVSNNSSLVLKA